jgi:hypothetical protein
MFFIYIYLYKIEKLMHILFVGVLSPERELVELGLSLCISVPRFSTLIVLIDYSNTFSQDKNRRSIYCARKPFAKPMRRP